MSFVQAFHLAQDPAVNSIALPCTGLGATNLLAGHLSWQVVGGTADLTSLTNAIIVDRQLAGGFAQVSYYVRNLVGGALTVTANFSSAVAFRRIQNLEYSGLDTSAAVLNAHIQNQSATFGTGADAVTSGAASTTVDGCTIVGFAYDNTSTTLPTNGVTPLFVSRDGFTNAAGDCLIGEDLVQAVQGAIAAKFNTAAGTDQIFVSMMAFAPPPAPTPAPYVEPSPTRNRPGRGPYSLGAYFRPSIDAFTTPPLPPSGAVQQLLMMLGMGS